MSYTLRSKHDRFADKEIHNRIYNESCLDTLARMSDDDVSLSITSPPYNMNLRIRNGKYCSRQIVKEFSTKYEGFDDNLPIDEYNEFHSKVLSELIRVSGLVFYNVSIVTGSKRSVFKMIGDFHEYLKDIIVWDKGHGQPAMQEQVLNRRTELILVFANENAISRQFKTYGRFARGTLSDLWEIPRQRSTSSKNIAVFPEELVRQILVNFTVESDLVYDPFLGTGTTMRVCNDYGRECIGSEINPDLVEHIIDNWMIYTYPQRYPADA